MNGEQERVFWLFPIQNFRIGKDDQIYFVKAPVVEKRSKTSKEGQLRRSEKVVVRKMREESICGVGGMIAQRLVLFQGLNEGQSIGTNTPDCQGKGAGVNANS